MPRILEGIISSTEFPKILQSLFTAGKVKAVVAAQQKKDRLTLAPNIATDAKTLAEFPLTNFIAYGFDTPDTSAGLVHRKLNGARDQRVAFVGRPRTSRALVELAKRKQINLENIVSVIIEGVGTVNAKKLTRHLKKSKIDPATFVNEYITKDNLVLFDASGKKTTVNFDKNLQRDDNFSTRGEVPADIYISLLGLPENGSRVYIAAGSPLGEEVIRASNLKMDALPAGYTELRNKLIAEGWDAMEAQLAEASNAWAKKSPTEQMEAISKCTMCGMCITTCPVCFCKDCNLKSQRKEKSIDSTTYQLTRLAHIGDACVGCGRCNSVCPVGVPLTVLLLEIRKGVKDRLHYEAGVSINDAPPRSKKSVCAA